MYVTKLGMFSGHKSRKDEADENIYDSDEGIRINDGGRAMKKCVQDKALGAEENFETILEKASYAYRFNRMDALLCVCKGLYQKGFKGESSAYFGEKEYFLLLKEKKDRYRLQNSSNFILEYGEKIDTGAFQIYIGEHGRCICSENAVSTLGELG